MTDQFRGRADTAEKESPAARCVDTTRAERKCRKRLRRPMLQEKLECPQGRCAANLPEALRRMDAKAHTETPPETRGPIEIEKPAATAARGLLKQKVPIQKNRLHSREQRIPTIQMPPTGLDHSDLRISKEMDCAL